MSEHFYTFEGKLNETLVALHDEIHHIKSLRDAFLKENGLLKQGTEYYDFTKDLDLTPEQIELLNPPKSQLKQDGTFRKNAKILKGFQESYHTFLADKGIDLERDASSELQSKLLNLIDTLSGISFRYSVILRNGKMYYKGTNPLEHRDGVIKITGLEYYKVLEGHSK